MRCARKLLAENLSNGFYKIVKESRFFGDTVVCYLKVDNGEYWFTNERDSHTILPKQEFSKAYYVNVENKMYKFVGETTLSMWLKYNEDDKNRIIDIVENLVLNYVIKLDTVL